MNKSKCYVIMKLAWAWDDSNYFISETTLKGYATEAYSTLEKATKAKEKLEYECWKGTIDDFEGTGDIWVYLDKLSRKSAFLEDKVNEKYNFKNLSIEAYQFFRKLLLEELEKNFLQELNNTEDIEWRKAIEKDYISYREPLSSVRLEELQFEQIKETLKNEGYEINNNISEKGLKRFQELWHQEYVKLPEFYYIQEAELVED